MINLYDFTHRLIKSGYNISLDSHSMNINSKITIKPNHLELEKIPVNNVLQEMANIHASLINQFKFINQVLFLARFDKQDEDDEVLDEVEI